LQRFQADMDILLKLSQMVRNFWEPCFTCGVSIDC
jgi:hypothetical protein